MNTFRLPYLLLVLVTCWFGASAVQATDPASPIGFWKGQDATFEMFQSEGKLSARQDQSPRVYWYCTHGPKLLLDQSELISATAIYRLPPVVILVSNGNTSRTVWEKLSDLGESHHAG